MTSGLKDFSFLHTPPTNRLSIKSFLKIETDNLMVEAIKREHSRDGQCFVIQNDIRKLDNLRDGESLNDNNDFQERFFNLLGIEDNSEYYRVMQGQARI